MPSFSSCKGIGDAAVDEILRNRPYANIEELFWNEDGSWKHSKLNKRAVSVLIKLRAFDSISWQDQFENYRHFHDTVIDNWNDLRKSTKRDPDRGKKNLQEKILESTTPPDWSMKDLAESSIELLGTVNVEMIMPPGLSDKLEQKGIDSIDNWSSEDIYWALLTDYVRKTTKKGKPYFILTALGTSGKKHKIFCWNAPKDANLSRYSIFAMQLQNGDFGFSTNWRKILELNKKSA